MPPEAIGSKSSLGIITKHIEPVEIALRKQQFKLHLADQAFLRTKPVSKSPDATDAEKNAMASAFESFSLLSAQTRDRTVPLERSISVLWGLIEIPLSSIQTIIQPKKSETTDKPTRRLPIRQEVYVAD